MATASIAMSGFAFAVALLGCSVDRGRISREGNGHIRRQLVTGKTAVLRHSRKDRERSPWVQGLLERKPARLVSVALADKTARVAWAVMTRGQTYAAGAA